MDLIAQQYRENGTKIVDNLERKHSEERIAITETLNQKKSEMLSIFSKAQEYVRDLTKDVKENSVSDFEREWRTKQEVIQKKISEGQKVSD